MRWFMGPGFGMGFGFFPGIIMPLVWVAVIVSVIYLIRPRIQEKTRAGEFALPQSSNKPLEILKERYARGEINDEEFERMKNKLS